MTWVLLGCSPRACLRRGARVSIKAAALRVAVCVLAMLGACDALLHAAVRSEKAEGVANKASVPSLSAGVDTPAGTSCGNACLEQDMRRVGRARAFQTTARQARPGFHREPDGFLDPWAMAQGLAFEIDNVGRVPRSPRVDGSRLVWILGGEHPVDRDGPSREGYVGSFRWRYGPTPFQQMRLDVQGALPLAVAGTRTSEDSEGHIAHAVCLLAFHPAAELDPGLPTVVLDPGHGGANVGASFKQHHESDLVLDIARRTRRSLQAIWPSLPVLLTRSSDRYVPLGERSRLATAVGAHVFVSIHLNDSDHPIKGGGVTTYYFGQSEARHLRRRMARHLVEVEAAPIASMIETHRLKGLSRASARLAKAIHQGTLHRARLHRPSLPDRGVRTEPFSVLVEADMPAVLLEASFLSADGEADLLVSEAYRQSLADGTASGIVRYLLDRAAIRNLSPASKAALRACGRLPSEQPALLNGTRG